METFDLVKGDSIVLYGAGAFGKNLYNRLKNIYSIQCFIDKRVKTVEEIPIPICTPKDAVKYSSCVVVVCVHNANWHIEIAEDLYFLGFKKIIFLAVAESYVRQLSNVMNRVYNALLEEQYNNLSNIPVYSLIREKGQHASGSVIRENDIWVVAWCGKDMLYTYDEVDKHQKKELNQTQRTWFDIPMNMSEAYVSLFRFFMYGQGNADIYVNNMKMFNNSFEMSDDEFLKEQYAIYRLLEREFETGTDSFQYAPIHVRWNRLGRGYFNIVDGHHRCIFYWLKGMQNMPVKMKRKDYDKWMNQKSFLKVNSLLESGQTLSMRINHPILRNCESIYREYESTLLDYLEEYIFSHHLNFRSVLEIDVYQGYYAVQFYRMRKAQIIECIVEEKSEIELVKQLFELQYIPDKTIKINSGLDECHGKFDLILILGIYNEGQLIEKMQHLKKITTHMLFWQSKENIETEKEILMEGLEFKSYQCLGRQYINGTIREIGVFNK